MARTQSEARRDAAREDTLERRCYAAWTVSVVVFPAVAALIWYAVKLRRLNPRMGRLYLGASATIILAWMAMGAYAASVGPL